MEWYEGHLGARPVVPNMLTGSFLWGIGDAVAQLVPVAAAQMSNDKKEDNDDKASEFVYDLPRTGRAVFFGFALHALTAHVHYNFLEWMTVRAGITGLYIPVFKAFMEQFVYWSWVSNTLYHGAMGAMQGLTLDQIYKRIEDLLWETQKAQWVFWIPIQLLNFQFVPVRHQLNVVLLTSIVWTALLSAWYPPEKKDEKNQSDDKKEE
jgi:protein Mpv17